VSDGWVLPLPPGEIATGGKAALAYMKKLFL